MLGEQVERVLSVFEKSQVHLIIFDDFKCDTRNVYEGVLQFLEIPSDNRQDFPRINENTVNSWDGLAKWITYPPEPLLSVKQGLKRVLGVRSLGLGNLVSRVNTRIENRPPLSPDVRQELADTFRDDVERLGQIVGRDLSHWITTQDAESPKIASQ